ncbi:unnamed protein product [Peniophora sp. CBMAI 1063]|nr:unnamed protein product [Peniophora sp. CBMAI 1063]
MSSALPLPTSLHAPSLSSEDLRRLSVAEDVIACCLPYQPNALPPLYLKPESDGDVSGEITWDVRAAPPIHLHEPQEDLTIYLDAKEFQAIPFTISWNGSRHCGPDPRGKFSAAQFTLINLAEESVIQILRLDCTSYKAIKVRPRRHHVLRSDDILAFPAADGLSFSYFSFRDIVDLTPGLVIHDGYEILRTLGTGAYGVVHLARNRKAGTLVAVKRQSYSLDRLQAGVQAIRQEAGYLRRIKEQCHLDHVCEILDDEKVFTIVDLPSDRRSKLAPKIVVLHIVTEFCEGGSLQDFLQMFPDGITEPEARYIARQVFRGLKVLHDENLIHRDLKPDNILMRWTPESNPHPCPGNRRPEHDVRNWTVKLADFGTVRERGPEEEGTTIRVGTSLWYPPELNPEGAGKRTHKSDVWTVGFIVACMLMGQIGRPQRGHVISHAQMGRHFSEEFENLMVNVLAPKPEHRFTTKEALDHPWFSTLDASSIYTPRATSTASDDTDSVSYYAPSFSSLDSRRSRSFHSDVDNFNGSSRSSAKTAGVPANTSGRLEIGHSTATALPLAVHIRLSESQTSARSFSSNLSNSSARSVSRNGIVGRWGHARALHFGGTLAPRPRRKQRPLKLAQELGVVAEEEEDQEEDEEEGVVDDDSGAEEETELSEDGREMDLTE